MTGSPVVAVRGEAIIEAQPELAVLTITIEAHGHDRRSAMDLLTQRARAVADVVERFSIGIERSETSRLHVYPELDNRRTEKVRRYVGRSSTSLTVHDFGVLSDLLVVVSSIDLISIDGPWWRLRPTSDVYRRARLAAAEDAKTRARDYADAFGATIVGLIEVADLGMSEQHVQPQRSARFAAMAAAREGASGADFAIEPAHQEVVGQVEARFLLTQPEPWSDGSDGDPA
jgi:uncharacterized protein